MGGQVTNAERLELFELIRTRSFRRGLFTLASGRQSELYFNLKPTMMWPRGAHLAARACLDILVAEGADYVGGLEMGVVPLIGAMAALGDAEGRAVKTFFVRKQPKDHGTQDVIEGLGPGESLRGAKVVIADDVATTAGSIIKALDAAESTGAVITSALVLVDREEGGAEALAERGVKLLSVFKGREFLA